MAEELEQLRARVQELEAERNRLQQERDTADAGSSAQGQQNISVTDRIIYLPRERKCPVFRGTHGIGVDEWVEEVKASMRVRHVGPADRAAFIFDHLEGEARDEIKYRSAAEREDSDKVFEILKELYGCQRPYVSLQEEFFSRRQLDGESLQEYSHALFCLMDKVEANAPYQLTNVSVMLRDQFAQNVNNSDLRRELKRHIRNNPNCTVLDVRAEAIRWEHEGGVINRNSHVSTFCAVQSASLPPPLESTPSAASQLATLSSIIQKQQEQLDQITKTLAAMQPSISSSVSDPVICYRCQQSGHIARFCTARVRSRPPRPSGTADTFTNLQPSEN